MTAAADTATGQGATARRPGRLFIVSAPSGAGKSTLCAAVRRRFPHLAYSVSYTTRKPRPGERNGREYHFIDKRSFEQGIAEGQWAEWAQVHGNLYGTSARWIADTLAAGRDILMDIDVQGTRQILQKFPEAITIFIQPPSLAVLEQRLRQRGTDDESAIATRLANAREEMAQARHYRHVVVNDDLARAEQALADLMQNAGKDAR